MESFMGEVHFAMAMGIFIKATLWKEERRVKAD